MPAKNHFSQEQRERLLKMLKQHDNPYVREKILILLLINDGKTYQEISKFLDIAYPTVAYWAVHGDPDNLDSFLDGRREGNFRKITQKYEKLLLEVIEKEPEELGYELGRWTAARLATNADSFYEQIKQLNNWLLKEWTEPGNKIDDFTTNSAKIVMILDNASFHKKKDILEKIEAEMPNIILEFLPPYSPDYNLIELVWHSAKEYIAHRLFESVEQLEDLLNKLLNEGGLVIKWERKIKNKGNAVY
ncbi:MAG TPA: hypothetical protein DCE56_13540 [Cyanobacteria bacterium UBA8553]|nr:hypothetical protein [Cyanobacteria bacterium UBA8553]HAJ63046.1 hypothetical protein [Cyanobacteria bacterium UBA8543]